MIGILIIAGFVFEKFNVMKGNNNTPVLTFIQNTYLCFEAFVNDYPQIVAKLMVIVI